MISERLFRVSPCKGEQILLSIFGVLVGIMVAVGGTGEGEGKREDVVVGADVLLDDACGLIAAVEPQPAQTIIININRKFFIFI
jgi:hypothetical protein